MLNTGDRFTMGDFVIGLVYIFFSCFGYWLVNSYLWAVMLIYGVVIVVNSSMRLRRRLKRHKV
jgi:uncharacterized protein (DUF983 family)